MTEKPIDVEVAKRLRATGLTYREIGKVLADNECREMPYQGSSVQHALRKSES